MRIQTDDTAADSDPEVARSHAREGGKGSVLPVKVQEEVPEWVERGVPDVIHDTGGK